MAPRRGRRAPAAAVSGGLRVVWRALRDEGARSATSGCRFRRIPARVPATAHGPGRAKMGFGIPPGPSKKKASPPGEFRFPLQKGFPSPGPSIKLRPARGISLSFGKGNTPPQGNFKGIFPCHPLPKMV